MKKIILNSILFVLMFCHFTFATPYRGVEFPSGSISFVDEVVLYIPGTGVYPPYNNPYGVLGVPEFSSGAGLVSLGDGGTIVMRFNDNSLVPSGDSGYDLWIFEVGSFEPVSVEISIDGIDWIYVGQTIGDGYGIDIDQYSSSGVELGEKYSFVRLLDLLPATTPSPDAGADIDSVGAISSGAPINPVPEPATIILLGTGLLGLVGASRKKFKRK